MYLESKASPYDTNICDSAEFDFVENIDQVVPQTEMDTTDFVNEDVPLCEDISIEEALVGSIDLSRVKVVQQEATAFRIENSCPNVIDNPYTKASVDLAITNALTRRIKIAYEDPQPELLHKKRYISLSQAMNAVKFSKGVLPIEVFF